MILRRRSVSVCHWASFADWWEFKWSVSPGLWSIINWYL